MCQCSSIKKLLTYLLTYGTWVEKHQRFLFNVYKRFLLLSRFLRFLTFLIFFWNVFYIYASTYLFSCPTAESWEKSRWKCVVETENKSVSNSDKTYIVHTLTPYRQHTYCYLEQTSSTRLSNNWQIVMAVESSRGVPFGSRIMKNWNLSYTVPKT